MIVLAGVVYYVSQQPTPQDLANKAKTPRILSFASTDATTLTISSGSSTTEVQRSNSSWQLVKPVATPADANRVQDWLDQLGSLNADQVVQGASSDLSQYGLSKPKLDVEVGLTSGKAATLKLGGKTPDGSDYYAQVPGDKNIYLVNAPLGDDLNSALAKPPVATPTPTPLPTLVPTTQTPLPAVTPPATGTPAG